MDFAFSSEKGAPNANEDACLALPEDGLFVVCDGLGQKGVGDIASRIAIETISSWIKKHKSNFDQGLALDKMSRRKIETVLEAGFQESAKEIYAAATNESKYHGMCTTMDVILFVGSHAMIGHVGSGRVYLYRNGELHQLTEDHTHLAHYRRAGKLEGVPIAQHASLAKRLTRAVGFQDHVKVDLLEVELEPGDRFLLLTDGVWMPLGEDHISQSLPAAKNSEQILKSLHDLVKKLGPKDNFTSVIVEAPRERVSAAFGSAEQKIKMLGNVPAFEFLSYQDLIKVINVGDLFKIASGKVICKEGDPGGEMMLILSGSVEIRKNNQKIRSLARGDVFGELSMIDEAPRSASVISTEATNLLAFPRDTLFKLFRERPDLTVKFLWGVTMETNKRLRAASNKMVGRPEQEGLDFKASGPVPFLRSK